MTFAISPVHTSDSFPTNPREWTLEQKFELFEAQILGWQIDIADNMMNKGLPSMRHAGYAALSVVMSYFENFARYYEGFVPQKSKNDSRQFFKKGLKLVYPSLFKGLSTNNSNDGGDKIYEFVRCGLYHSGLTQGQVILSSTFLKGISMSGNQQQYEVNPHQLIKDLKDSFEKYKQKVIHERDKKLRMNFERRFNFDKKFPIQ